MPTASRFADQFELRRHYIEHFKEFGARNEGDYLGKACAFMNASLGGGNVTQERVRTNGDVVRFNPTTDEFGVMAANGILITYFKPVPAHLAPSGTPRRKTHRFTTNYEYFVDTASR